MEHTSSRRCDRERPLTVSPPRPRNCPSPSSSQQGTVYVAPGSPPPLESVHATLAFTVPGTTVSGLGVRDLLLTNEGYKFFKGVRVTMRSGRITVRT